MAARRAEPIRARLPVSPGASLGCRGCLSGMKVQRHAVHAVALTCRLRPVLEDMAQMSTAAAAMNLGSCHEKAAVGFGLDGFVERRPKARPSGAAVELGVGGERPAARNRRNGRPRRHTACRAGSTRRVRCRAPAARGIAPQTAYAATPLRSAPPGMTSPANVRARSSARKDPLPCRSPLENATDLISDRRRLR